MYSREDLPHSDGSLLHRQPVVSMSDEGTVCQLGAAPHSLAEQEAQVYFNPQRGTILGLSVQVKA